MIEITTKIRFTVVPQKRGDQGRLFFSALITPMVTTSDQSSRKVLELPAFNPWPKFIGLPFHESDKPTRFEVLLSQPPALNAKVPAQGFKIDNSCLDEISGKRNFNPERSQELWNAVMGKAWIASEESKAFSATPAQANQTIVKSADDARNAGRAHQPTVEGVNSEDLNLIAYSFFKARALDSLFPGDDIQLRRELLEYDFLLSRMQRQGQAGDSNRVAKQKTNASQGGNNPNPPPQDCDKDREFHQLISSYGSHPFILRALGLLFDFSIDRPPESINTTSPFLVSLILKLGDDQIVNDIRFTVVPTEEKPAPENSTDWHAGETLCQVFDNSLFFPVPADPATTALDNKAQYFRSERFDSVQWDLLALLRAALREMDFVAPPPNPTGGSLASQRPPLVDLPSRGITLFRRNGGTLREALDSLLQNSARPSENYFSGAWTADDLVRGYRVEVSRCLMNADRSKRHSWSEWKSLTLRRISYYLSPEPPKLNDRGKLEPLTDSERKSRILFEAQDHAPISLALTESLQPLSGWLLDYADAIELDPSELSQLDLTSVQGATVLVQTYYLQTNSGTVVVADAPNQDDLTAWQNKPANASHAAPGPIQKAIARITSAQAPFLFGQYLDLEGIVSGFIWHREVPPNPHSGSNLFLAQKCRFQTIDEGYGLAGAVVGNPQASSSLADGVVGSVETVIKVQRAVTHKTLPVSSESSYVHLRKTVKGAEPAPISEDAFKHFLQNLPESLQVCASEGALFIEALGEFALGISSTAQIHVAGFLQPAVKPGDLEQGLLFLQYIGPDPSGRFNFSLYEPEVASGSNTFLPVSLEITSATSIQTLTKASASPADMTPQALFRAALQRSSDASIEVVSLVELGEASPVTVVSLDGPGQISVKISEAHDPMPIEVHPTLTIVECAEPAPPPSSIAGPANDSDSTDITGTDNSSPDQARADTGSGNYYIRGNWAEQGMLLQIQDQCQMQFTSASKASGLSLRATRIVVLQHDPDLTLVGYFQAAIDSNKDSPREDIFAFQQLTPKVASTSTPGPSPSASPSSSPSQGQSPSPPAPVQLLIDNNALIVSGPGLPGQPWRYRQGPPLPRVLAKVYLSSGASKTAPSPLPVRAIEVLSGLEVAALIFPDQNSVQFSLPGFIDQFQAPLSSELVSLFKDLGTNILGRSRATIHFRVDRGDNTVSELEFRCQGSVAPNSDGTYNITLSYSSTPLRIPKSAIPNPPSWPTGLSPDPNMQVEMTLTLTSYKDGQIKVDVKKAVRPLVRLQLYDFDPITRRAAVQVVFRTSTGTPLPPGTQTVLYLERSADVDTDPFGYLQPQIGEMTKSRLPIDFEAVDTVVVNIPSPLDQKAPNEPVPAQISQWSLFAWPATTDLLNMGNEPPTYVHSDNLVTLWPDLPAEFVFGGNSPPSSSSSYYRLVARLNGTLWQTVFGTEDSFEQQQPTSNFPGDINFLADQMIVDDSVFHWHGHSLAVGTPGAAGLTSKNSQANNDFSDPIRLDISLPDRESMPLRYGWLYSFRLRPIFITGNSPDVPDLDPNEGIPFRPFGGCLAELLPDQPDLVGSQLGDLSHDSAGYLPFLRLEAIAPPRIGWPARAQKADFLKTNAWGDSKNIRLLTAGPSGLSCNKKPGAAASDFSLVQRQPPELVIYAPEAPFRIAELTGFLDYLYHAASSGNSRFDEHAGRFLYELLKKLDSAAPKPLPPGFVPERLPDPHSDQISLELRPYDETNATKITFNLDKETWPVPRFGTDPATWLHNGHKTTSLSLHVLATPPPKRGTLQIVGGITIALEKGALNLYLPPNADCELTLRSIPKTEALRELGLARLLEQIQYNRTQNVDAAWDDLKSGHHPIVSPGTTVRIRHMTARPAAPPEKISLLMAGRLVGTTKAVFDGSYRIDRPSTGGILIQAATEIPYEDDPGAPLPRVPLAELMLILPQIQGETPPLGPTTKDTAVRTFFGFSSDDLSTISSDDYTISQLVPVDPGRSSTAQPSTPAPISQTGDNVEQIRYEHDVGDTRHRAVFYRPLAVSRFQDFFPEAERALNPCPGPYDNPPIDQEASDPDARIRWDRVEIPATARPHPPVLYDQNIVFEFTPSWENNNAAWKKAETGWVFLRTRLSGVRLWLERPWYSSGSGESLAVVCWNRTRIYEAEIERYLRTVSRWGTDPIFEQKVGPDTDMGVLTRGDFTHADSNSPGDLTVPPSSSDQYATSVEIKAQSSPAPSVTPTPTPTPATTSTISDQSASSEPALALAVHQVKFHPDEKLWFSDIFIRPRRYAPHVSLSIVRYQPFALPTCAVSEPIRVDWTQIQPPRSLRVEARVDGTLQIEALLTGIFPPNPDKDRRLVVCRVQRFPKSLRPEGVASAELGELGWRAVDMPLQGFASPHLGEESANHAENAAESVNRFVSGLPLNLEHNSEGTRYRLRFEVECGPLGPIPGSASRTLAKSPSVSSSAKGAVPAKSAFGQEPSDEYWNAGDALRICVEEHELYPAAYPMTEGKTWLPRLIYSDQAHLPDDLTSRFLSQ